MTVLSVVKGNNAALIAEVAKLYIKPAYRVLDTTYGLGVFWKKFRPEGLVTSDLYKRADFSYDFRFLPGEWVSSFDVVVFDPPYTTTGTKAKSTTKEMHQRYGTDEKGPANRQELWTLILGGMHEAKRVLKSKGLLWVKCCNYIESGKYVQGHRHVVSIAQAYDFEQLDEFILHTNPGPQPKVNLDGSPRRQVHARRCHSYLCIFRKRK